MTLFFAGMVIFFGSHLVRVVAPDLRDKVIARLGPLGWRAVYSVVSIVGLVLLVKGYADAKPHSPWLWSLPVWIRHVAALVMLPVLVLLVSAYLPGRIRATVKHPMILAVLLWAAAHLAANGQAVDLLLFGTFFAWSLVVGAAAYTRKDAGSAPSRPATPVSDLIAVVVGAGLWAWLAFGGHRVLFGLPVFG